MSVHRCIDYFKCCKFIFYMHRKVYTQSVFGKRSKKIYFFLQYFFTFFFFDTKYVHHVSSSGKILKCHTLNEKEHLFVIDFQNIIWASQKGIL